MNLSLNYEKLEQAFGKRSSARVQVFRWHEPFLERRKNGRRISHREALNLKNWRRVERVRILVKIYKQVLEMLGKSVVCVRADTWILRHIGASCCLALPRV